jgi:hypothetical protein
MEEDMRKLATGSLAAVVAVTTIGIFSAPTVAVAGCRGFGCKLVKDIPVVNSLAEAADDGIAAMKDRGSSADVLHHATGLNAWNNPIGQPATSPQATVPVMGNRCATDVGAFLGPWNPVGSSCSAVTAWGYASGIVIQ